MRLAHVVALAPLLLVACSSSPPNHESTTNFSLYLPKPGERTEKPNQWGESTWRFTPEPRVGQTGRLTGTFSAAPGFAGYFNIDRYRQLWLADDRMGLDEMYARGELIDIGECNVRVLDVIGNARRRYEELFCELRIESGPHEGTSAWIHFNGASRMNAVWE